MESHIIDIDEDPALRPESKRKDHDPEPESKSSDLDFRPGSNIWSLYLEDAEQAAKEKVELMKSGLLDSVLVFAGLFAGVVSSFVIDARSDIQDDSEQNLLSDIRDALRGSPIEVVRIPISASWISALWLVSLYLTLFSAIMGILAKAWLANLIPTNTRRQASDAYDRYKLDTECTYYLQPAITVMFLLIQIASILFLVGLHASTPADGSYQQNETLSNYLLAFLRFAHQFEANTRGLGAELGEINLKDYSTLLQALKTLLEPGHPLHRRNTLPETLHPLRLALRTEVFCLFRQLPLEHSPSLHLMDFHSTEMDACPWNWVQGDIRSSHRLYVMLAACRGALQAERNVMKVSALILGQSITQAGLTVLDMGRTSEWAPDTAMNERQMIDAQGLDVLSRLLSAIELNADLFSPTSITTISNMIVYEDEDFREAGLRILVHLVTSSNGMMPLVTTALLASAETGFNHDEEEPRLRTIAFVRAIWDDLGSPFYSLINRWIPRLVEIALTEHSTDIRQRALHLAKDVWARGFATEIKSAISKTFNAKWDSLGLRKRHGIVTELLELLEDDGLKDASEKPPYAFAWDHPSDLVVDIFPAVFERITRTAIHNGDDSIREAASILLKKLSEDGRVSGMLKVDALTWLEAAAVQPSLSRARRDAVLVSGIFINQLDLTNKDLLKKLVEWAGTDRDSDVRRSSIGLVTTICKWHSLSSEILEAVKSTILSVKDRVIKEGDYNTRSLWIVFLSDMVKYVSFPGVVPILLKFYVKLDSDSEMWKNAHEEFLMLGEHEDAGLKESVDKVLKGIAKDVRDGIEAKPPPKPVETDSDAQESQAQDETDYDGVMDYMPQSTLKLPLRRLLYRVGRNDRKIWADVVATISAHFPLDFQDAHTILFQIAKCDFYTDVQNACLESLSLLAKQAITGGLINDTINNFDYFSNHSDWGVRVSYMRLLSSIGSSKEGKRPIAPTIQILLMMTTVDLSDEVLKNLSARALLDPDYDCRSEAVNTFLNLLEIEDSDQNPSPKERYRAYVETMVKDQFHAGIEDDNWKVRQLWIKLAGTQIKDAEFPELTKLFNASIKDSDSNVQAEAMEVLQRLLEDAKLRASIAEKLGKALGSCLSAPEYTDCAVSVLTTITTPLYAQEDGYGKDLRERHQLWIQIILLLGRNVEFQALPKLIEVVIKEERSDTAFESQDALYSLFQNINLPDPIDSILPKAIESALKLDEPFNVRSVAVNLFGHLIGCVPGRGEGQPRYENLLGWSSDLQIISRLADIIIKDDYDHVRIAALRVLKTTYKAPDLFRFRDAIKASVSKIIESSLKDPENSRLRTNAVSVVNNLTGENSNDRFRDFVSPSISQLLRTVLLEGDENLGNSVEWVLFGNFTATTTETKLNRDILIAIPPMLATLTVAGKAIVMRLAENLAISDDTAATIAHALTPMLRNTLFARATAIAFLLKLYKKRRYSKPELIESPVTEIISLAFDDKDDIEEVRIPAIQLLVAMSLVPASLENAGQGQLGRLTVTTGSVLKQITPLTTKFMELLRIEHLRPSVVKLLSLMSLDATVRRTITLSIAATAFGSEKHILIAHVELLAQLISDGRLGKTATDYMMVVLAPALVTRPELAPYRLVIMTGLWCRYGQRTLGNDNIPENPADQKELLDWFKFALFGHHITVREATTWLTRYAIWLPRVAGKKERDFPSPLT
ncbi:hypothetical protein H1R20_g1142, partial [Candolleomyces eurysporus]